MSDGSDTESEKVLASDSPDVEAHKHVLAADDEDSEKPDVEAHKVLAKDDEDSDTPDVEAHKHIV